MALIIDQILTGNGSSGVGSIKNPNTGASPYQVVYASGTFGGGSLAIEISNDGGSTWFAATDSSGSVSFTSPGSARLFLLGNNNPVASSQIKIRGNLSGSTTPSLKFSVADIS